MTLPTTRSDPMDGQTLWQRLFLTHPAEVDESYRRHGAEAAWIGAQLIGAGLACCLHALIPGLCTRTASRAIGRVQARMHARQERVVDRTGP